MGMFRQNGPPQAPQLAAQKAVQRSTPPPNLKPQGVLQPIAGSAMNQATAQMAQDAFNRRGGMPSQMSGIGQKTAQDAVGATPPAQQTPLPNPYLNQVPEQYRANLLAPTAQPQGIPDAFKDYFNPVQQAPQDMPQPVGAGAGFGKPFQPANVDMGRPMKKGGAVKKFAKGGSVSSASSRGDGIAQRGKTRGKFV